MSVSWQAKVYSEGTNDLKFGVFSFKFTAELITINGQCGHKSGTTPLIEGHHSKGGCYRWELKAGAGRPLLVIYSVTMSLYTPYEDLNLADQMNRKLGVFGRKLEGNYSPFYCYFDRYWIKLNNNVETIFSSLI